MNGLSREFIIHPGETVKEILEERDMTQRELAIRADVTEKHISNVVNCQTRSRFPLPKGWNMRWVLTQASGSTCRQTTIKSWVIWKKVKRFPTKSWRFYLWQ